MLWGQKHQQEAYALNIFKTEYKKDTDKRQENV